MGGKALGWRSERVDKAEHTGSAASSPTHLLDPARPAQRMHAAAAQPSGAGGSTTYLRDVRAAASSARDVSARRGSERSRAPRSDLVHELVPLVLFEITRSFVGGL